MDPIFVARIIFSLIAVAISVGPMVADFNKTHATNPLWTPHARFHVVWQVLTQAGVSIIILALLWMPAPDQSTHTWIAVCLLYVWFIAFYATLGSMSLFEGSLKDVNGIKPWHWKLFGKTYLVDTNLGGGTILFIINSVGVYLLIA
ncbi:MAG: hypothetical protein NXH87_12400 [Rhodobiaceae bacterium]|nr:hypothetical protein RHODOSMS8_03463 [Rhodobiaceae bacterium]MCR9242172.1 hypothetical protein [Rhodobiaceae bacterium]